MLIPAIAIGLSVLLGQAAPETDVVFLKDGTNRKGVIVEETDELLVIQVTVTGTKGETAVTGPVKIPQGDILEIRRMDPAAREKAKARSEASGVRAEWAREDRLAQIAVTPAKFDGYEGLKATGEQFEVLTTSDEVFAREACDVLQQAHEGYLRHFKLRRTGVQRIPVVILTGHAQYDEYLTKRFGGTYPGSLGLYSPKDNVIISFNGIEREEAARIKKEVLEQRRRIEEVRKAIREHEERVNERAKERKAFVVNEAADAKADIRRADPPNRPALLLEVDAWVAERFKAISEWKAHNLKTLGGFRRLADEGIAASRKIIAHNERVLRDRNREMFETLFHECFHAFANNRLYVDKEIPRWLNEGMACYFEMSVMEAGELIHGAPNRERMNLYREALAKKKVPDLRAVLRGTDFVIEHAGHIDRAVAAYAVSWALAHYLCTRMTRDEMDAYVASVTAGADPVDALVKALNQPLPRIEEAVRAHVAALK